MNKSSKIIIILLIVLIIAVLGVGGYIVFKMNDKEEKNDNTQVVQNDSNQPKINNESVKNENIRNENVKSGGSSNTETTTLTSAELKEIETYLNETVNNGFANPYNTYSKPEEIKLDTIFYDSFAVGENNEISEEEMNAYKQKGGDGTTDLRKVTTKQAEQRFLEKTGEKLTNLKSRLNWTYIEKYDAYYTEGGDTGMMNIKCESGTKTSDGKYVIKIKADAWNDQYVYSTLTMKKSGNNYIFVSNENTSNSKKK